jgi:hypothetical protein
VDAGRNPVVAEEPRLAVLDRDLAAQLQGLVNTPAMARSCSLTGSYRGMLNGISEAAVPARNSGTLATVWTPIEVTAVAPAWSSGRASASNR